MTADSDQIYYISVNPNEKEISLDIAFHTAFILSFLEEVGKEFNVTRERIRQIEAKALRKLRNPVTQCMITLKH